jgi:hypothetical protein
VFLDRLDVVFANHYFAALEAAQRGHSVPRCWQVLWQRRGHAEVAPLQFAVAGMNAHINHDLVLAVVETLAEFGTDAHDPTMHADFVRVNTLLGRLEGDIRRSFEHGFLLRLERHWGRLEDRVEGWSIAVARAAAWQDAEWLWRVRNHALARARYEQALDAAVALAGCCLLAPLRHAAELHGERCATQGPVLSGGV